MRRGCLYAYVIIISLYDREVAIDRCYYYIPIWEGGGHIFLVSQYPYMRGRWYRYLLSHIPIWEGGGHIYLLSLYPYMRGRWHRYLVSLYPYLRWRWAYISGITISLLSHIPIWGGVAIDIYILSLYDWWEGSVYRYMLSLYPYIRGQWPYLHHSFRR